MIFKNFRHGLSCSTALVTVAILGAQLVGPQMAFATDFKVDTAITVQNHDIVLSDNNTLTITSDGSIDIPTGGTVNTQAAVRFNGNFNTITNNGNLTTSANSAGNGSASAIWFGGNSNTVVNTGTISTSGTDADGIRLQDPATGTLNDVKNSGTITVTGINGNAVVLYGFGSNTFENTGSLIVAGTGHYAIWTDRNNTLSNTGTISSTSSQTVTGGVDLVGTGNTFTNTGKILTVNGSSILTEATGNTVNLKAPSFLAGIVTMNNTATVNITTGPSHSVLWDFAGTFANAGAVPTVDGSVTSFFTGSTFATYDPSSLAGTSNSLAQMSGLLSGVIQGRLDGNEAGSNALGYAANNSSIIAETFAEVETTNEGWVQVVGNFGKYDGTGGTLDSTQKQLALVAGYDVSISTDTIFGFMAGYTQGKLKSDSKFADAVDNATKGGFAGIYGRTELDGSFISYAVTGGAAQHDDSRFVNDNLAPLGVAYALSDYTSTWINPEIAYGIYYDLSDGWVAAPTVRLSYAAQWSDGYTETGTRFNATVGDRQIAVGEISLEWSATKQTETSSTTIRAGYTYRASMGDDTTDVTLLGITKAVSNVSENKHIAYIGADTRLALSENVDLEFGGQVEIGENHASGAGSIKLIAKF